MTCTWSEFGYTLFGFCVLFLIGFLCGRKTKEG